jgi:hypothetical protein
MKTQDKNLNNQSQSKNQNNQSGQINKDQKYGKSSIGSVEPKSSRDLNGNVDDKLGKTASRDRSSRDDLDDTDDENVY